MTLETIIFAYVLQWVKRRGRILCKSLGVILPIPVKCLRLTGAIGAGL